MWLWNLYLVESIWNPRLGLHSSIFHYVTLQSNVKFKEIQSSVFNLFFLIFCHYETIISSLLVAPSKEIKIESVRELLAEKKYKIIGFDKHELAIVQSIVLKTKQSEWEVNRSIYKYNRDVQLFTADLRNTQMGKGDAAYLSAKIRNIGYT